MTRLQIYMMRAWIIWAEAVYCMFLTGLYCIVHDLVQPNMSSILNSCLALNFRWIPLHNTWHHSVQVSTVNEFLSVYVCDGSNVAIKELINFSCAHLCSSLFMRLIINLLFTIGKYFRKNLLPRPPHFEKVQLCHMIVEVMLLFDTGLRVLERRGSWPHILTASWRPSNITLSFSPSSWSLKTFWNLWRARIFLPPLDVHFKTRWVFLRF